MKVLLDEMLPIGVRQFLPQHDVVTAAFAGLAGISNGEMIRRAIDGGFDVIVSLDLGIPHQQNLDRHGTSIEEAALYEAPFEYVRTHVKPEREAGLPTIKEWWLHERPGHSMRAALSRVHRQIATPRISKHRVFVWLPPDTLVDSAGVSIARDDDYTFGVLQSRTHELWALALGTQLETRPRYTPTTCFETFPFPHLTDDQRERVGEAARRLVELRDGWLNPPGLDPAELEKRTLTNLYNQRPTWLDHAHAALDTAVFAAYGWPTDLTDTEILERLLSLNLERSASENAPNSNEVVSNAPHAALRREVRRLRDELGQDGR